MDLLDSIESRLYLLVINLAADLVSSHVPNILISYVATLASARATNWRNSL